ncbi:SDR family oxidoreductase [Rhodococcus sp. WS3]|uniref:SDR family oxidoreductase n=1 Tax=Rhodococcus sp. WS3 TaxID=2486271 RepID=UPI00114258A3|nr:SDR family oxidoreductase [Rhodococcus sp. WS3]ROZ43988.1 SDR family oxidoreductase [Rhodococcus sp. WS3]
MSERSRTIAVTGATGHIGGEVARILTESGIPLRLIARSISRLPQLPGAESAEATFSDHDRAAAALHGIDILFMVSAAESADRLDQHRTFIDAAVSAGVRHIVYTSYLGAAPDATFTLARDHWATEQHIRSTAMSFTFLRDSAYLDFLPAMAGADGVIRGPAGNGAVGAVARSDIARVAASVLTDPDAHVGRTYDLTGREALTLAEVAAIITDVTGRETVYHEETVEEAYASRASYNAPDWEVDAWVSTYTAIANGELAVISTAVEDITGRPPLTLRELLTSDLGNDLNTDETGTDA